MAGSKKSEGEQVTIPIDDREDRHDEFTSDSNKCPECGEPIENIRATCPKCGYEYSGSDYDDADAGQEFVAGAQVDDEGDEVLDGQVAGDDDAAEDEDTSESSDSEASSDSDSSSDRG